VADIKMTLYSYYWYGWFAAAQVTVKDQTAQWCPTRPWLAIGPVSPRGQFWETGSNGSVTFSSAATTKRGTFTFAVTGISLTGLHYAPTQTRKTQASISTP